MKYIIWKKLNFQIIIKKNIFWNDISWCYSGLFKLTHLLICKSNCWIFNTENLLFCIINQNLLSTFCGLIKLLVECIINLFKVIWSYFWFVCFITNYWKQTDSTNKKIIQMKLGSRSNHSICIFFSWRFFIEFKRASLPGFKQERVALV